MLETLKQLDRDLFIHLNEMHSPIWDTIMIFMSDKYVWIPFYLGLIGYLAWRYRRQSIAMVLLVIASIGAADFIASGLMKPYFMRLRPCHDPALAEVINVVQNCGGKFGFISSHAANTFALAVFFSLVLSERYLLFKVLLLSWAVIVTYSRIYLGVHYPSDVLLGALLGSVLAYLASLAYGLILRRYTYFRL
jgi:undecaprenyl-diphosphatase